MREGIALSQILSGDNHSPVVYFLRVGDRVKSGRPRSWRGGTATAPGPPPTPPNPPLIQPR